MELGYNKELEKRFTEDNRYDISITNRIWLLDIKAVYLKPENQHMGIRIKSCFPRQRITLSYPETRTLIENGFVEKIKERIPSK